MIEHIIRFFERIEGRLKRQERQRIRRLEADLAQAKLVLSFYGRAESYPKFVMAGQQGAVLEDRGLRARETLKSLKSPWVPLEHLLPAAPAAVAWATYRDKEGQILGERRTVVPA